MTRNSGKITYKSYGYIPQASGCFKQRHLIDRLILNSHSQKRSKRAELTTLYMLKGTVYDSCGCNLIL
jgi:hypothetical protein